MSQYPVHEIHVPDPQPHAVATERFRHDGALFQWGEYAIFVLMWNSDDADAGLVGPCPACYSAFGVIAEAYGQPARRNCPECFGTALEGGYRAKLVRPSLWDHNEEDRRAHARGDISVATGSVQSTSDFQMRTGDYIVRADNKRWQIRSQSTNHLHTGFEWPSTERSTLGYNFGQVSLEDVNAVSSLIPPTSDEDVLALLDRVGKRRPVDFTAFDEIRGPLIVE